MASSAVGPSGDFFSTLLAFFAAVPTSSESRSDTPAVRAAALATQRAKAAASLSGAAALVPGPLGFATLLPDILGICKIQAQLVADIAAVYGRTESLDDATMAYCLVRHYSAQAARGLLVHQTTRGLTRKPALRAMQKAAALMGSKLGQRAVSKGVARFIPLIGAVGVAAYAYYDTKQVAKAAIGLFGDEPAETVPKGAMLDDA
jgi:uncharacterized protein (DUF697 family)